jgi:hypothetical protein
MIGESQSRKPVLFDLMELQICTFCFDLSLGDTRSLTIFSPNPIAQVGLEVTL